MDADEYKTVKESAVNFVTLKITEEQLKQFMDVADEDALTDVLVVPFLRNIGFRCILKKGHRDRSLEFGQDLRSFKFQLPTGHWLYFAAQVKTQDLIYSSEEGEGKTNVDKVITQLNMAFEHEMFDLETGGKFLPDHIFLITSHDANEGARLYIQEKIYREKRRRVLIWYGENLIERILLIGLPESNQLEIIKYINTSKRES